MKRRFYLVSAAIALVCAPASYANDIENAITKYGGKIGIKGSAANLLNKEVHNLTAPATANSAGTAATTTTTTSTTTTTTTSKASSFKNALEKVFSKSNAAAPAATTAPAATNQLTSNPITSNPTTTNPTSVNPGLPAASLPGQKQQSIKTKIGKEIWREAKRYESKHPNKLIHTGVNSLNKVVGQP